MTPSRLASTLVVSLALLVTVGCKKDPPAEGEGKADATKQDKAPEAGKQPEATPTPTPTPDPGEVADGAGEDEDKGAAGAGGGGGGAGGGGVAVDDEDKTCDPSKKGECLEGETCIGSQGCDAAWECDAEIVCKKGVREYCGCDGKTFEAVYGNCPWKKYQYPGPCK